MYSTDFSFQLQNRIRFRSNLANRFRDGLLHETETLFYSENRCMCGNFIATPPPPTLKLVATLYKIGALICSAYLLWECTCLWCDLRSPEGRLQRTWLLRKRVNTRSRPWNRAKSDRSNANRGGYSRIGARRCTRRSVPPNDAIHSTPNLYQIFGSTNKRCRNRHMGLLHNTGV